MRGCRQFDKLYPSTRSTPVHNCWSILFFVHFASGSLPVGGPTRASGFQKDIMHTEWSASIELNLRV
jgi:hypothetical protein